MDAELGGLDFTWKGAPVVTAEASYHRCPFRGNRLVSLVYEEKPPGKLNQGKIKPGKPGFTRNRHLFFEQNKKDTYASYTCTTSSP